MPHAFSKFAAGAKPPSTRTNGNASKRSTSQEAKVSATAIQAVEDALNNRESGWGGATEAPHPALPDAKNQCCNGRSTPRLGPPGILQIRRP